MQPSAHPRARQTDIVVVAETGSTNADLLAQVDDLHGPSLLLAESQTAGRGRMGRSWHSAPQQSLTFSLAWPFRLALHQMLGLPLAVGVALAQALAAYGVQVQLKWPNDILKDGKKLAGILLESTHSSHDPDTTWAIIGVGMNLQVPPTLEAQIGQAVADAPWLAQLDRNTLAAHLLHHLASVLEQFEQAGWPSFIEQWQQLHAFNGQDVVILEQGKVLQQGRALGVDAQGRLLLATSAGVETVLTGDVSLRSQAQYQQMLEK
ncbi:MAG: biotin--[acetyl-CoA-carboxylase] ligase [Burkholderiales bacterium]|nr:biotin--[acetyl-CoA-carboxylase] ligase [Burkholderiales bacterium]